MRGLDRATVESRVARVAATLDIAPLLDRKPSQLSGGQRQRVALGRAIVREPQAFLLDEPLSNLDPLLRVGTRAELALLHRRLGATMVYVTHDQEEAMTLGARIAVMNEGRIEQVAAPIETFERPATAFVARFVGSPAMNLWRGRIALDNGRLQAATAAFTLGLASPGPPAETAFIGVRPHDIAVTTPDEGDLRGAVEVVEPLGAQTTLHVEVKDSGNGLVRVLVPSSHAARAGDHVGLKLRRDRLHLFDADGRRRP
jgi:multiple sugar transport system ATP-binding protein